MSRFKAADHELVLKEDVDIVALDHRARPESSNIVDVEGGQSWRTRPSGRVVELAHLRADDY